MKLAGSAPARASSRWLPETSSSMRGDQLQGNLVDHTPEHAHAQPVAGRSRRAGRGAVAQPEVAGVVELRLGDRAAIKREAQQGGVARHRQRFGALAPLKAAADLVAAGRHAQRGTPLAHADHGRLLADAYVLRPAPLVTGQRRPAVGVRRPALAEGATARIEPQLELGGPRAAAFLVAVVNERATRFAFREQHPVDPVAQRGRQLPGPDALGVRGVGEPAHEQQQDHQQDARARVSRVFHRGGLQPWRGRRVLWGVRVPSGPAPIETQRGADVHRHVAGIVRRLGRILELNRFGDGSGGCALCGSLPHRITALTRKPSCTIIRRALIRMVV